MRPPGPAAGLLGRKTGLGWYRYEGRAHREPDPEPPSLGGGERRAVTIAGGGTLARELRERALAAGWDAREPGAGRGPEPELVIDAAVGGAPADGAAGWSGEEIGKTPLLRLCAVHSLAATGAVEAVGFHLLPPLADVRLVELTRLPSTPAASADAAEAFFGSLGLACEWVQDAPGLVLGRIVCQLVNEAAFAIGEGVGSAADVDAGVTLDLNHPRGPVAWGEAIGLEHVLATIDGLWEERHEERYRAAPRLRRAAATDSSLD